jgi:hypothetical protein
MRTDTLDYVAPDGTVTRLTGQPDLDVHWALGVTGRFMPPINRVEDRLFGQAGARLRAVRVDAREVNLPLTVIGTNELAVRAKLRALIRTLNPQRGDGRLRVTAVDGTVRELTCRYSDGMEGRESRSDTGAVFQRAVLVLRAADPYWYDTDQQSQTYRAGQAGMFFASPFFGLRLSSESVFGSQVVANDGDVETWPVWTVHGPCTSITLSNDTTGETISLPITLTATQTVTIDTRPFRKTVRRDDGTNLYGSLSATSSLWALPLGDSTVTISLPGATADSYVTLNYARRWLTP